MRKSMHLGFLLFISLIFSGCASKQALYSWGPYQDQTYSYLKGESPEQQVVILEKHLVEANSTGKRLPPGFHAHVGLLYSKVGRDAEAAAMFELEKSSYPESTKFINNIKSGFGGSK